MGSSFDALRGMRTGFGPFEAPLTIDNVVFDLRNSDHADDAWKPVATHRGELAGLTPEARAAAVERHEHEMESDVCEPLVELFAAGASKRPAVDSLPEVLALFNEDDLLDMADTFSIRDASQFSKDALIEALTQSWQSEDFLFELIGSASMGQLGTLSRLLDAPNLRVELPYERIWNFSVLTPLWPVVCLFQGNDAFTLLVPHELSAIISSERFAGRLKQRLLLQKRIEHLAQVLVTFCGAVSLEEFYRRYEEFYGETLSNDSFRAAMGAYLDDMQDEGDFTVWLDPSKFKDDDDIPEDLPLGEIFLVSGEFGTFFYLEDHPNMNRNVALKERDDIVRGIIGYHKKYEYLGPCPIDPELTNVDADVFDWQKARPSAFDVLAWLDEHVPNTGAHDYTFAEDELLGLLYKEAQSPTFVEFEDAVLSDRVADLAEDLNPFLARLAKLSDELPKWMYNGWAPVDNPALPHARVQFVDSDLNPVNPDRNAPCPCGSGKKYKKCCGR